MFLDLEQNRERLLIQYMSCEPPILKSSLVFESSVLALSSSNLAARDQSFLKKITVASEL